MAEGAVIQHLPGWVEEGDLLEEPRWSTFFLHPDSQLFLSSGKDPPLQLDKALTPRFPPHSQLETGVLERGAVTGMWVSMVTLSTHPPITNWWESGAREPGYPGNSLEAPAKGLLPQVGAGVVMETPWQHCGRCQRPGPLPAWGYGA